MKMHGRTLVVDDDEMNVAIMMEILGDQCDLIIARNGNEALEIVEENDVALVLLDIMMPGIDGYQVCRQIKSSAKGEATHVVLVSAKASTAERVVGYEAGADDYLVKPFDGDELLAKVRVQLRLRNALVELAKARQETVVDNVRLERIVEQQTRDLLETRDLVVFALAKLADSRDPETGSHLERIRAYGQILAEQLCREGPYTDVVDHAFIDNIYLSSPMHDIGKVGIPDAILLKPEQLTDDEFNMMKMHCAIGANALSEVLRHGNSGRFLTMAIEIATWHHERWDGSGYPDGLAGQDIPLSARIVALADVFDALTSVRVYKDAILPQVARTMIENGAGQHFDPDVVDAFRRRFDDFLTVRQQFTEADRRASAELSDADRAA